MNNTGILKKAIDELQKETPKLEYVRGILETLYDMQEPLARSSTVELASYTRPVVGSIPAAPTEADDEAAILDAKARAAIRDVQAIAAASTQE